MSNVGREDGMEIGLVLCADSYNLISAQPALDALESTVNVPYTSVLKILLLLKFRPTLEPTQQSALSTMNHQIR